MGDRNTSIRGDQIKDLTIKPEDLNATTPLGTGMDNYVPSYDEATGKFTWIAVAGGVSNLPDLNDVDFDTGTPADDYIMRYDSASGKWKAEALVINTDKIEEGDSKVEVVDTGTGYIIVVVDGVEEARINSSGLKLKSGADINEFSIDGTLVGDSDDAIPTEKAVKTYVDGLTNIDDFTIKRTNNILKIADRIEMNIMLNFFHDAIDESRSVYSMVDGVVDEFEDETGVDTASSTNEIYNSTDDYYTPEKELGGIDTNTKLMLHANGQDGGKEIIDSGNTGHVVTQNGTAQLSTAQKKFGSCGLYLDGNSDYLSIPDSPDWDIGTNFTIDFWVKHTDHVDYEIYLQQYESDTDYWYFIHLHGSGIKFRFKSGGVNIVETDFGGEITDTDWHHIALCKVGNEYGIYKDGNQIAHTSDSDTDILTGSLNIGAGDWSTGYFSYLDGYMDEIRIQHSNIFNASPSTGNSDTITVPTSEHTSDSNTKLLLHMNSHDVSGDGGSGNYHIPTFYGTMQLDTTNKKWGSSSFQFDGDSDYITFPDSNDWDWNVTNVTWDLWVKHTDHAGNESYIEQYQDATHLINLIHMDGSGIRFRIYSVSSLVELIGGEITDTDWHHIAIIKVGNEYGIYKDGTQVAYVSDADIATLTGNLCIGRWGGAGSYFSGYMDEIRIQHSNIFSASPNVGKTDTITVPTGEYGTTGITYNMTLIAEDTNAEAIPDSSRIVLFEEDVDSITINTDLKAYVSRDGGASWVEVTLTDEGDYDNNKRILTAIADLTVTGIGSGTGNPMRWKVATLNNKDLKLHGVALLWD